MEQKVIEKFNSLNVQGMLCMRSSVILRTCCARLWFNSLRVEKHSRVIVETCHGTSDSSMVQVFYKGMLCMCLNVKDVEIV